MPWAPLSIAQCYHGDAPRGDRWKRSRGSTLVLAWWLLFLASRTLPVFGRVASLRATSPWDDEPDVAGLVAAARWDLWSDMADVPAALAAIFVVVRISAMQARDPGERVAQVFE